MGRKRVYTEADISGIVRETAVAEGYDKTGGTWTEDGTVDESGIEPSYTLQNPGDYEAIRVLADEISTATVNEDVEMRADGRSSGYRYVTQSGHTTGATAVPLGTSTNLGGIRTLVCTITRARDEGIIFNGPVEIGNIGADTVLVGQCEPATWPVSDISIRISAFPQENITFKATIEGWVP